MVGFRPTIHVFYGTVAPRLAANARMVATSATMAFHERPFILRSAHRARLEG
jgi:hypothetical protein